MMHKTTVQPITISEFRNDLRRGFRKGATYYGLDPDSFAAIFDADDRPHYYIEIYKKLRKTGASSATCQGFAVAHYIHIQRRINKA